MATDTTQIQSAARRDLPDTTVRVDGALASTGSGSRPPSAPHRRGYDLGPARVAMTKEEAQVLASAMEAELVAIDGETNEAPGSPRRGQRHRRLSANCTLGPSRLAPALIEHWQASKRCGCAPCRARAGLLGDLLTRLFDAVDPVPGDGAAPHD